MPPTDDMVELKDVIEKLRTELEEAVAAGEGKNLQFEVQNIDLELKVAVVSKGGGKFTLKLPTFGEFGAEGGLERQNTQTVKLTLKPRHNGQPALVSSRE